MLFLLSCLNTALSSPNKAYNTVTFSRGARRTKKAIGNTVRNYRGDLRRVCSFSLVLLFLFNLIFWLGFNPVVLIWFVSVMLFPKSFLQARFLYLSCDISPLNKTWSLSYFSVWDCIPFFPLNIFHLFYPRLLGRELPQFFWLKRPNSQKWELFFFHFCSWYLDPTYHFHSSILLFPLSILFALQLLFSSSLLDT